MLIKTLHSVSLAIQRHGKPCSILRKRKDEYGKPIGEDAILSCSGLFHEASGFLSLNLSDQGQIPPLRQPQLLILYPEQTLKEKDLVILDKRRFEVTGIHDPGFLHICLNLSLKEVV